MVARRVVLDLREGPQRGPQAYDGRLSRLGHRGEPVEMCVDLAFVPCGEDGLGVGKVLVQRRAPDVGVAGTVVAESCWTAAAGDVVIVLIVVKIALIAWARVRIRRR
ncbi:hypothetical protein GCM10011574_04790 [Microbispora bryophytorum]|uniref:Uncharacterized protein n=1 Tax=Microbispora bryophytorum TaxID=1460882 RepID=A0A8H9LDZ4_9ACTN|nr:hypothetical protein GCM10011574_04790 [Microbispora bryophytorum]